MARKGIHVGNKLRLLGGCSSTAYASPKGDGLAGNLALEGAKNELWAGWCGEGVEGVEAWGLLVLGPRGR